MLESSSTGSQGVWILQEILKHRLQQLDERPFSPMNLNGFPWPPIGERKIVPAWEGGHFTVDSERFEILTYSQAESAWSPELTALHEKEASTSHPIDIAS